MYLPSGLRTLQREVARTPRGLVNLHALTLEALVPRDEASLDVGRSEVFASEIAAAPFDVCEDPRGCPFVRCRAFRHERSAFSAYGGNAVAAGKSLGVLACPTLQPVSPHHFGADRFSSAASGSMRGTVLLPPHVAVILHYESCSYRRWKQKFCDYARHHRRAEEEIRLEAANAQQRANELAVREDEAASGPGCARRGGLRTGRDHRAELQRRWERKDPGFAFYQQSMWGCMRLLEAEKTAASCTDSKVYRERVRHAESACQQLWAQHKLEPGSALLHKAFARAKMQSRPYVITQMGLTLIQPCFEPVGGTVQLPAWHPDGLTVRHQAATIGALPLTAPRASTAPLTPAPDAFAPRTIGSSTTDGSLAPPSSWAALVERAALPIEVAHKLATAASMDTEAPMPGATPNEHPAMTSREALETVARRAGLTVGQRLRLKGVVRLVAR